MKPDHVIAFLIQIPNLLKLLNMEFPLIGEYREVFMVLEIIIVLLCWEFGVIFFNKYYQNKKNRKLTKIELAWAII